MMRIARNLKESVEDDMRNGPSHSYAYKNEHANFAHVERSSRFFYYKFNSPRVHVPRVPPVPLARSNKQ